MGSFFVPLEACFSVAEAGGKAVGLARLLQAGFPVPSGICLTTAAYHDAARQFGIDLTRRWRNVERAAPADRREQLRSVQALFTAAPFAADWLPELESRLKTLVNGDAPYWAVRSSASNEDAADVSSAGLYKTELGVSLGSILFAVRRCWASIWEEAVVAYFSRHTPGHSPPAMAVIIQPMVAARSAGVVFSQNPISGRSTEVLINVVTGLAAPMVSGQLDPDQFVIGVDRPQAIREYRRARRPFAMKLSPEGVVVERSTEAMEHGESLTHDEALQLAMEAKSIERAMGAAVDVEWALDENRALWFLQARPISARRDINLTALGSCDWSRANFKETMPELPSPLSLSFLTRFMEDFILRRYRELGCQMAPGESAVRVIHGRPFINVTLLQSCLAQLGGKPELLTEQMGGQGQPRQPLPPRLPVLKLIAALVRLRRGIRQSLREAPAWFAELKQTAEAETAGTTAVTPVPDLLRRMERLSARLYEKDCTFALVAAVGQAQQVLAALLLRWVGRDWQPLFNAALQGQGTIISANQIRWLQHLGDLARSEPRAMDFFTGEPWKPHSYRNRLATTRWLHEFDHFLQEYGHRATGESDVMSPRFTEHPEYVLDIIRGHVRTPPRESREQAAERQQENRKAALTTIRNRCGWRYHRWLVFQWWYARLIRALELREANRHYLMHYSSAMRTLLLLIGSRLVADGRLSTADDVFFLTVEECERLADPTSFPDWLALVAKRRAAYVAHAGTTVPDFIPGHGHNPAGDRTDAFTDHSCRGLPISAGVAEGPISVVRGTEDVEKVRHGDIVVMPVLDPGMAAIFGIAGGVIAEMGGTLSHGAIIAREYGIPAIANIPHATQIFKDGERVTLDAATGVVQRVGLDLSTHIT